MSFVPTIMFFLLDLHEHSIFLEENRKLGCVMYFLLYTFVVTTISFASKFGFWLDFCLSLVFVGIIWYCNIYAVAKANNYI